MTTLPFDSHISSPTVASNDWLTPSRTAKGWGWGLTGLGVLFLTFDTVLKLLRSAEAIESSAALGFSAGAVFVLGLVELVCLALYLIPRTALFGAILWTGYLGGAIATHVRLGNPLFSHLLFPVYVALLLWFGLGLRSRALRRAVVAFRG